MQTNPKFFVYIDTYIDVLTMYISLKKQAVFQKINNSCKLILKLTNSTGLVAR